MLGGTCQAKAEDWEEPARRRTLAFGATPPHASSVQNDMTAASTPQHHHDPRVYAVKTWLFAADDALSSATASSAIQLIGVLAATCVHATTKCTASEDEKSQSSYGIGMSHVYCTELAASTLHRAGLC